MYAFMTMWAFLDIWLRICEDEYMVQLIGYEFVMVWLEELENTVDDCVRIY